MLTCSKCGEEKPDADFWRNPKCGGRRGRASQCKRCIRERRSLAENRAKVSAHDATPEGRAATRARNLKRRGLTPEQYDAMLATQGGVCAICKQPETSTSRGVLLSLAADHDHATGADRDLLCANCNNGLGRFCDDPDLLMAAALYLLRHRIGVDKS